MSAREFAPAWLASMTPSSLEQTLSLSLETVAFDAQVCLPRCRDMEREISRLKETRTRSPYIVSGTSLRRRDGSVAGAALLAGATPASAPFSPARNVLASPMMRASRSRLLVTEPPPMAKMEGLAPAHGVDSAGTGTAGTLLARQGSLWVPPSKCANRHAGKTTLTWKRNRSCTCARPITAAGVK